MEDGAIKLQFSVARCHFMYKAEVEMHMPSVLFVTVCTILAQ